jgi:hypothetical protein
MGLGGWHRHFARMTDMGFMVEESEVGELVIKARLYLLKK